MMPFLMTFWNSFHDKVPPLNLYDVNAVDFTCLHLLSLDLTKDIPTCRYQLKIIKLIFEKEIANAKFEALSDPFSNAQTKLKILQDLSHEIGWDIWVI